MADGFQRLFARPEHQVLSMNVQAALGPVRAPRRNQFSQLVRHFLERFFNHETASPDGDAKTRMVQIACATGLPPFVIAIYLWPAYHPIKGWPPGQPHSGELPTYWLQVNHHLFFVLYSFIALGIATVFEWDLFFPDLLDLVVLGPLPISSRRLFTARVASIAIFVAGLLFNANFFAAFVLPMATDPAHIGPFLAGHLLAVGTAGLFAALLVLALNGLLLAIGGERFFRPIALLLQGALITALVMMILLFPVLSGVVPVLLQNGGAFAHWFPPFWFLGLYQRLLEGPSALPIYAALAQRAVLATASAAVLAALAYPVAYLRKTRQLIEGPGAHSTRRLLRPAHRILRSTLLRHPIRRAVFHFISQTLPRVTRYRIYLVLYGGVGLSVVTASILHFSSAHQQVHAAIASEGVRAALAIIVFWIVAGLRMAFVSSGNQRGRWLFRMISGNPPDFASAIEHSRATRTWVLLTTMLCTLLAGVALNLVAPPDLRTTPALASQALFAAGMCLLLTDAFFLNVTAVPFTGESSREQPNLALTVLKYFTFFPLVAALPLRLEPWIEAKPIHFLIAALAFAAAHLLFARSHQRILRENSNQLALEDDEEDFPMRLGLRY
jgi:hypothetical protein